MAGKSFNQVYNDIIKYISTDLEVNSNEKHKIVRCLWDTGANYSCISKELAKELLLVSTGITVVNTAGGTKYVNKYCVNLMLPNNVEIINLEVCASDIGLQGLGMLIGMDIITLGDFAICNKNGKTTFSFNIPSDYCIDFSNMEKYNV